MDSLELVDSFSEFKELKNIDKGTMQSVLEDVFRSMLKKKFNTDEHIDIIVNIDKGDVQIFLNKEMLMLDKSLLIIYLHKFIRNLM